MLTDGQFDCFRENVVRLPIAEVEAELDTVDIALRTVREGLDASPALEVGILEGRATPSALVRLGHNDFE